MLITHKLHGAVVGEKLLDSNAPVLPGNQSTVRPVRLTQVADPRVHLRQCIKRPWTDEDVQAVITERPAEGEERGEGR